MPIPRDDPLERPERRSEQFPALGIRPEKLKEGVLLTLSDITPAGIGAAPVVHGHLKDNLDAVTDPGVTDDEDSGYTTGSMWVRIAATVKVWILVTAAVGAADWNRIDAAGGGGDVATDAIWDAKGDLAGGTGSDTAARLAVGSDAKVLTADAAEATGMKWAAAAGGPPTGAAGGGLGGTYPDPTVDAIKLDDAATPDDNADLDASTSLHGLLKKLGGGTTNFLRADGSWAAPPGGNGGVSDHGALTGLGDDDHTQYQEEDEKDADSGYVGRDANGKADIKGLVLEDVDGTPVGDILLKVIDEVLRIRNEADDAYKNVEMSELILGLPTNNGVLLKAQAGILVARKGDDSALAVISSGGIQANSIDTQSGTDRLTLGGRTNLRRLYIPTSIGDPGTVGNGDIWYDLVTAKFRAREDGASVDMIGGGGGTHPVDLASDVTGILADANIDTALLRKALFDGNTILAANSDNTPAALTIAASRILGRKSSGNIGALTGAEILAILSGQAGANFSMNTKKITAVVDPTSNQDAATKKYVDDVKLDDAATPDDNTDLDASTSKHGLLPKLDNSLSHFLDGQGGWSTPSGGGGVGGVMDADLSQVDVLSSTAEETLYSYTIPGDTLGATGGFRLTIGGDAYVNAAGTFVLRVKLGATTVAATANVDLNNQASNRYKWYLALVCQNSTTGAQKWVGEFHIIHRSEDFPIALGSSDNTVHGTIYATSTEDTTADLLLDITAQWSVNSGSLSIRKEMAILELAGDSHAESHSLASHSTKPHSALSDAPADVHADTKVRTKEVDEASIDDGKVLVYRTSSGKLEYETPAAGNGGGGIGFEDLWTIDGVIGV